MRFCRNAVVASQIVVTVILLTSQVLHEYGSALVFSNSRGGGPRLLPSFHSFLKQQLHQQTITDCRHSLHTNSPSDCKAFLSSLVPAACGSPEGFVAIVQPDSSTLQLCHQFTQLHLRTTSVLRREINMFY